MKFLLSAFVALQSVSAHLSQIPFQDKPQAEAFQIYQSQFSPHHSIRIRQQQDDRLCDAHSKQYTGWLDVGAKHLFFWYFKSQNNPTTDPLVLWLSGGPGCSGNVGLLQELGPCRINEFGNGTTFNEHGWNKNANVIFVDQPAGVGFSYLDEGESLPKSSFTAAEDMHLFLQLFTSDVFPDLLGRELHISGESYGGHYVPTLGAQIVSENLHYPRRPQVNLQSTFTGNAFVSPWHRAFGYWETLCTTNPGVEKPIFNQTRCDIMATHIPRCMDLAQLCNNHPDPAICDAARDVCWNGVIKHYDDEPDRNRFDITQPCETKDEFCYVEIPKIEKYLNLPWVWEALGVPKAVGNYTLYSEDIEKAFILNNDKGVSTEPQVLYLLENGIDVMFYQGNLDIACNTAGNLQWASNLQWKGQPAFVAQSKMGWKLGDEEVGWFKEVKAETAGGKETTFAFTTINGAGHLVPYNKPREALAMVDRWLKKRSCA